MFEPSPNFTICPFKGRATYWSLTAVDPVEKDIVWTYSEPFDEVGGIEGYVAFYQERVRIELEEHWSGDATPARPVVNRFPAWGDAADLLALIDVYPERRRPATSSARRTATPRATSSRAGRCSRRASCAASKMLPRQRVTSATMYFPKAAAFDAPLDVDVDVLREGRTFSTAEVRISQDDKLRSVGLYLLDSGAPHVIDGSVAMPDVGGTRRCRALRHAGDGPRAANRERRLPPRSRPHRTARAARLDPVQATRRPSRISTPR